MKESIESTDVVVASNGTSALLYVHPDFGARTPLVGRFLADQEWAETVLDGDALASVGQGRDHGLAFAVSMRASDEPNAYGIAGTSLVAERAGNKADVLGSGQHGGLGAGEQAPFLMIDGAGFRRGMARQEPSCIIDIAPTILVHLGFPASGMDGRPLQGARADRNG